MPRTTGRQDRPQRTPAETGARAKRNRDNGNANWRTSERSGVATGTREWSRGFGQKIIGRSAILGNRCFPNPGIAASRDGMLALIDQVAREQRDRVFLEPLIEQRCNLFAEIGGMPETGKLAGLKRVARSGKRKLPGSLGVEFRHKNLRGPGQREYESDIGIIVLFCQIGLLVQALWKTVKKQENVMDCCSACACDYEDLERSAWLDVEENEEDTNSSASGEARN
jgi:hypothetical protein